MRNAALLSPLRNAAPVVSLASGDSQTQKRTKINSTATIAPDANNRFRGGDLAGFSSQAIPNAAKSGRAKTATVTNFTG